MFGWMPCSGQNLYSSRKNSWGIAREDGPLWWRLEDRAGRMRTFPNFEKAEAVALRLEASPELALPKKESP